MIAPRSFVNFLSLSRIGIAFLFILCFHRKAALFYVSILLFVIAWATDLLDGYLARKFRIASTYGRHWDSLGDKAFYTAAIVAFNSQGFLAPLLSWALIFREIALYITRILFIENLPKMTRLHPFTKWHGYFMYLTIIWGIFRMYAELRSLPFSSYPYMQVSACAALAFGIASIIQFIRLH
jgi:cardiolipin synthase